MEDCIFCKIVNKQITANLLYEDEHCVIFPDINPKAKTHLLIVTKKHIPSVAEMQEGDEKIIGHMVRCAKELALKIAIKGYKLQIHVGKDGGQEIFHVHMHLISNSA